VGEIVYHIAELLARFRTSHGGSNATLMYIYADTQLVQYRHKILPMPPAPAPDHSNPILASSPMPQSPSRSTCGLASSSSLEPRDSLPLALERFSAPDLKPEDLVLALSSATTSL
jgi:hypothetical protein